MRDRRAIDDMIMRDVAGPSQATSIQPTNKPAHSRRRPPRARHPSKNQRGQLESKDRKVELAARRIAPALPRISHHRKASFGDDGVVRFAGRPTGGGRRRRDLLVGENWGPIRSTGPDLLRICAVLAWIHRSAVGSRPGLRFK